MIDPNRRYLIRRRRARILQFVVLTVAAATVFGYARQSSRQFFLSKAPLTSLETYVDQNPSDDDAAFRLAYQLVGDERDTEARAIMEKLVREHPDSAQYRFGLGRLNGVAGRSAEALADYHAALSIDPKFWQAHLSIGAIYSRAGLATDALREYEIVRAAGQSLRPDDVGVVQANLALGRFKQAWDSAMEVLAANPMQDAVFPAVVEAGMQQRRYDELEAILTRRLANSPMYPVLEVRGGLIRLLLAEPRSPALMQRVDKLARAGFTPAGVTADYDAVNAEVLFAEKRDREARKSVEDGLKLDHDNIDCLKLKARIQDEAKDAVGAAATLSRLARLQHKSPETERLSRLVAAAPTDPSLRRALAAAMLSAGDAVHATEQYEQLAALMPGDPGLPDLIEQTRRTALQQADMAAAKKSGSSPSGMPPQS